MPRLAEPYMAKTILSLPERGSWREQNLEIAYFGNFNPERAEKWQSEAEPFQIVFLSKMEYNETINILPRLRLRYGRNLI